MLALGHLFAQSVTPDMPGVTLADVGMVVTALAVILLVIDRVKSLFWPSKPIQEEYVRRIEMDELKTKLESCVTRLELQRIETQITNLVQDHKDLVKWTSTKYDDMCKSIGDIRVTVEQVRREIHVETNNAAEKVINRLVEQLHKHPHGGEV